MTCHACKDEGELTFVRHRISVSRFASWRRLIKEVVRRPCPECRSRC